MFGRDMFPFAGVLTRLDSSDHGKRRGGHLRAYAPRTVAMDGETRLPTTHEPAQGLLFCCASDVLGCRLLHTCNACGHAGKISCCYGGGGLARSRSPESFSIGRLLVCRGKRKRASKHIQANTGELGQEWRTKCAIEIVDMARGGAGM